MYNPLQANLSVRIQCLLRLWSRQVLINEYSSSVLVETYAIALIVETSNCVDINSVLVKTLVATSIEQMNSQIQCLLRLIPRFFLIIFMIFQIIVLNFSIFACSSSAFIRVRFCQPETKSSLFYFKS